MTGVKGLRVPLNNRSPWGANRERGGSFPRYRHPSRGSPMIRQFLTVACATILFLQAPSKVLPDAVIEGVQMIVRMLQVLTATSLVLASLLLTRGILGQTLQNTACAKNVLCTSF